MRYIDKGDFQIAADFLFLSMTIIVINQDIERINSGSFKIKEPYLNLLHQMLSSAIKVRKELRKAMKKKQLKVIRLSGNDSFTTYLFVAGGKEVRKNYFNPVIRKKVGQMVEKLMVDALQQYSPSFAFD